MKRFLSMILAVLTVLSLTAVFAVSASAETEGLTGLTVTMGTTYAEAGKDAFVDLYISAATLPATYERLRDWQFQFEGAQVGTGTVFAPEKVKDFTNVNTNTVGATTDVGYFFASAAQTTCPGGMLVASIHFVVPADATGTIEVSIAAVDALSFEDSVNTQFPEKNADITLIPGQIIIVDSVEGTTAYYEGQGEDYVVPAADGNTRITSLLTDEGECALTGEFGILTIPASVGDVGDGLDEIESVEAIVLKSTALDDGDAKGVSSLGSTSDPVPVYILKRANGLDTTADAFDSLSTTNKRKVDVRYLLQVVESAITVDGDTVAFAGGIAVDDLDFGTISLTINFVEAGKCFTAEKTSVATTVTGVASADADTAAAAGIATAEGMTWLTGAVVKGVPSGSYAVEVTVYATTADANGNMIVVCSETLQTTVTVG